MKMRILRRLLGWRESRPEEKNKAVLIDSRDVGQEPSSHSSVDLRNNQDRIGSMTGNGNVGHRFENNKRVSNRVGMAERRYEAALYAEDGGHSMSLFRDVDEARKWVMKQYGGFYGPGQAAAVVYDLEENRKRVFETDDPRGFLPQESPFQIMG